MVIVT